MAFGGVASAQVAEEWVARYNGPANLGDEAKAITTDSAGNVYVAGLSGISEVVTVKYDASGTVLWFAQKPGLTCVGPFDIALDGTGNVYVAHGCQTIKYDASGNELWSLPFPTGTDIVVGPSGSIYFTNDLTGDVRKIGPSGNLLWSHFNIFGQAIVLDPSENVYVTGNGGSSSTGGEMKTVKYTAAGAIVWEALYDGPAHWVDDGVAIGLDTAGNVYVAGTSVGTGTSDDYVTIKYDPNGNQLWAARYSGPTGGNTVDQPKALTVDGGGNVYVTGRSSNGLSFDYATVKYGSNGTQLWVTRYDNGGDDFANDIAVDAVGNTYVTGEGSRPAAWSEYVTIKYDTNGTQIWLARYDGPGGWADRTNAIVLEGTGILPGSPLPPPNAHVYITGGSDVVPSNTFNFSDFITIKYSQAVNGPDLAVTMTDSPDPVTVGNTLTYAVTVTNIGTAPATGVTLTDMLPAEVEFVVILPSPPPPPGGGAVTCGYANGTVTCNKASLSNGSNFTVRIAVRPVQAGSIRNTASVTTNELDPPGNNSATVITQAVPDTTSPTQPVNLTAIPVNSTRITLAWDPSTDDVAVTGYRVERCQSAGCMNFAFLASVAGTSYNDYPLTTGTSYTYRVLAEDAALNSSPPSPPATATMPDDTAFAGTTQRVSVDGNGVQGSNDSVLPAMTGDGRFVAFSSWASNLVLGDTNGGFDVFVHDRLTGATERVSVDNNGNEGQSPGSSSSTVSLSADGRYVAFSSEYPNLVASDSNAMPDIFVRDRLIGTTVRVSVGSGGVQGNERSFTPSLSADGRYVVFESLANNLVSGDTNARWDIFRHDRQMGVTERVSVASAGTQANGDSYAPSQSPDGRYVVWYSSASNLVSGDTNGVPDVFVKDLQTEVVERVSVDSNEIQGNGLSQSPGISADGRYVVFASEATNLVTGDTNAVRDVFVRDRQAGATRRVSVDSNGVQGNAAVGFLYQYSISADGRLVPFPSGATNLVPGDTNGVQDVFVHDLLTGATERVNLDSAEVQGNALSDHTAISADGRFVAFASTATNLVSGDTNGVKDVFVRDRGAMPTAFTLTVAKSGTGTGTVSAEGIACGADCTETYPTGTVVTLTAVFDLGSVFSGANGDAGCADGSVTMTANKTCTVTFVPVNTGFRSPTANAPETSVGDNNGYQTTPANAHLDDTLNAVDTDSGSGTGTSCTSGGKDKHRFSNYGFSIPSGVAIRGIEVRLDAMADNTSGSPRICIQLSWDAGTTWTTAKTTTTLATTMATFLLGSSTDTWGRTWSATEFADANFRVRVIDVASDMSRDFFLDWVAVRVHLGDPIGPMITSTPVTTGKVGLPYSYQAIATGTPSITWSLVSGPSGMSINANTGLVTWTPSAVESVAVEITANNVALSFATQSYTVTVTAPGSTPLLNPTANAAETSSAGDNNGYETTPGNAHVDDALNAVDTNSGSGNNSSCSNNNKDKHRFYNYGFSIPSGSTITGIEVRLDARADATSGSPRICVQLSWDGGVTWTTEQSASLGTSMNTYTLGGATNTWGRTWSLNDLSNANFRVRVINVASDTSRDFYLDWVAVRVYY